MTSCGNVCVSHVGRNTETLLDAIMEAGLQLNASKIKYRPMPVSRHQDAGHHNKRTAKQFFKNVTRFKYFVMTDDEYT
jgi:hypothetical protein